MMIIALYLSTLTLTRSFPCDPFSFDLEYGLANAARIPLPADVDVYKY